MLGAFHSVSNDTNCITILLLIHMSESDGAGGGGVEPGRNPDCAGGSHYTANKGG